MTSSTPAARAAEVFSRPFTLGGLTVPNRVAMAPMTRGFSPDGVPGKDVADYYARRAAGGVGLIITEGTYVGHDAAGTSGSIPLFHGEEALAGWQRVVEAVHAEGATIMPQLWHVGMAREAGAPPVPSAPPSGPSGVALDGTPEAGHALTRQEIDDVVQAFADAAAAAERIGFDGIELHGAHGYLIDQFLWETTNRRTDEYGGDLAARTRFATELVAACRKAVSPGFPILFRMSQWKMGNYTARIAGSPEELEAIVTPLAEAGVDAFHCSTRRYWLPEFEGSDLNLAGWVKKLTGRPTLTVGSVGLDNEFMNSMTGDDTEAGVTGIEGLLDRLERDEFDLVAVGRALISDPEWVEKVVQGRTGELVPFDKSMLSTLN